MAGRNFSNPLYNSSIVQSGLPAVPPKTSRPYAAFPQQGHQQQQQQLPQSQSQLLQTQLLRSSQQQQPHLPNAFHSSHSSSHNSDPLLQQQQQNRLSGNNNSFINNGVTNNNSVYHPSMTHSLNQGVKSSSSSGAPGAKSMLNSEDEKLLQEWSLLSLRTDAGPTPPAREKTQHQQQLRGGVAARPRPSPESNGTSAASAAAADPFADLVTF